MEIMSKTRKFSSEGECLFFKITHCVCGNMWKLVTPAEAPFHILIHMLRA
jgi:hypothetical protein